MTDQWVTVAGTLGGVTITAAAALISQHQQRKYQSEREMTAARRETYGSYLTSANAYYASLTDLSWAVRNWHEGHDELIERTKEADRRRVQFISARGQLDIVAVNESAKDAASSLSRRLRDIERQIFLIRRHIKEPRERRRALPIEAGWEIIFTGPRDEFIRAAQTELRVHPAQPSKTVLARNMTSDGSAQPSASPKFRLFTVPRNDYAGRICASLVGHGSPDGNMLLTMDEQLLEWLRGEVRGVRPAPRGDPPQKNKTWRLSRDGRWATLTGPMFVYLDTIRTSDPTAALTWAIAVDDHYLASLQQALG